MPRAAENQNEHGSLILLYKGSPGNGQTGRNQSNEGKVPPLKGVAMR